MRIVKVTTMKFGNKESGYTLVEMSIVLLILSVVLLGVGMGYKAYIREETSTRVQISKNDLRGALSSFLYMKGRLPCPADASLARTDNDYGREDCRALAAVRKVNGAIGLVNTGECTQAIGGICNTAYADPATDSNIRRGMVPFVTLGIPEEKAYDPYGMRLTYMVSMKQTDITTYVKGGGTIQLRDIATVGGVERSLLNNPDRADFVVFSSGANRVGAFPKDRPPCGAGSPLSPDGKCHITTLPFPCTPANTGGAGEFANCSPLTEIVYAGDVGKRRAETALEWATSAFLDDDLAYFSGNEVTSWRQSLTSPNNIVLRDAGGSVGIGLGVAAPAKKLDLGTHASATLRSEGAVVVTNTENLTPSTLPLCADATQTNCFDPKTLYGNPDLATGGLKCPAGNLMRGIKKSGTSIVADCVPVSGTFCQAGWRLKGFNLDGSPFCLNPATVNCPALSVAVCDRENPSGPTDNTDTQRAAAYINRHLFLAAGDKRAWLESDRIGRNPDRTVAAGSANGTTIEATINSVILRDSTRNCAELKALNLITTNHKNQLPASLPDPGLFCRYGFSGGERKVKWKCVDGGWIKESVEGVCTTTVCTPTEIDLERDCNSVEWSHNKNPTGTPNGSPAPVRLTLPDGSSSGTTKYADDDRANLDTRQVWVGTFRTIGTTCGGAVTNDADEKCRCPDGTGFDKNTDITCPEGMKVNPDVVPESQRITDYRYTEKLRFNCRPSETRGRWTQRSPNPANACMCDSGASRDVPYTCKAGTVAAGGAIKWVQNRVCPGNVWDDPGTPGPGRCQCTPSLNVEKPTAAIVYNNCADTFYHAATGFTVLGSPGYFGRKTFIPKFDTLCDGDLATAEPVVANHVFYPNGIRGTEVPSSPPATNAFRVIDECLPMDSVWTPVGVGVHVTVNPGGKTKGLSCVGAVERAACISAGFSSCPSAEIPQPCVEILGTDSYFKYDNCTCS